MSTGWWIERGPNGGYVAAVVLRALATAVEDPARTPAVLHRPLPRAAGEGPVQIDVQIERPGRMLTFVSGRAAPGRSPDRHRAGRLRRRRCPAWSSATCSRPTSCRPRPSTPTVIPPAMRRSSRCGSATSCAGRSARRSSAARRRRSLGGWIRLRPGRGHAAPPTTSSSPPSPTRGCRRSSPGWTTRGVPTIDLTIHFRAPIPPGRRGVVPGRVPLPDGRRRLRGGGRRGVERRRSACWPTPASWPCCCPARVTADVAVTARPWRWRRRITPTITPL